MVDKAIYGLFSGVSLVVATLIGIAFLNTPAAESADVTASRCMRPALEQGYGLAPVARSCLRPGN